MHNPYLFCALSQSNQKLVSEINEHEAYVISGKQLAKLVAIKETLFMERRLTGDTQRDMAQVIDHLLIGREAI